MSLHSPSPNRGLPERAVRNVLGAAKETLWNAPGRGMKKSSDPFGKTMDAATETVVTAGVETAKLGGKAVVYIIEQTASAIFGVLKAGGRAALSLPIVPGPRRP